MDHKSLRSKTYLVNNIVQSKVMRLLMRVLTMSAGSFRKAKKPNVACQTTKPTDSLAIMVKNNSDNSIENQTRTGKRIPRQ